MCFFISISFAQIEYISGEYIIQLKKGIDKESFQKELAQQFDGEAFFLDPISEKRGIYTLRFLEDREGVQLRRASLANHPFIALSQPNIKVQYRELTPDDPFFGDQWNMSKIGGPEAWEVTTGGVTPQGDTIVTAIIDSGFDILHPEFKGKIWTNPAEIDGDGIDNDNNGYIDDKVGWHFDNDNDQHGKSQHGTGVAGIIGARGNNGSAGAGINWGGKILTLSNPSGDLDQVLEAYYYCADLRQRYNQTNGAEGAFIVVTNSSFGVDKAQCSGYPLWEAAYDSLGRAGILSVAATANGNFFVDEIGDLPTSCVSEYLVAVTNTDEQDQKVTAAGFGRISIDLGAPGENIQSSRPDNDFGAIGSGTSFSTPHVAGAIALLYSVPCELVAENAIADPSGTALIIRDFLLNGVDRLPQLEEITKTGGRLNLDNSIKSIQEFCGGQEGPLNVSNLFPNPVYNYLRFEVVTPDFDPYDIRIYNMLGQLMFQDKITPRRFAPNNFRIELTLDQSNVVPWLSPGVYYLVVENINGIESKKFLVVNSE